MKGYNGQIILSCEHGGNQIPSNYQKLFKRQVNLLNSHYAYDKGALVVARRLSKRLKAPLIYSITSRLLIDLNRSLHHPGLFSDFSRSANDIIKSEIIKHHYSPYHSRIGKLIDESIQHNKRAFHFSIHSFTPELNGEVRNADFGILYNPSRNIEKKIAKSLQLFIKENSGFSVRLNYPYLGKADGLTTILRKKYPVSRYCGIEIEMNQSAFDNPRNKTNEFVYILTKGIGEVLGVRSIIPRRIFT